MRRLYARWIGARAEDRTTISLTPVCSFSFDLDVRYSLYLRARRRRQWTGGLHSPYAAPFIPADVRASADLRPITAPLPRIRRPSRHSRSSRTVTIRFSSTCQATRAACTSEISSCAFFPTQTHPHTPQRTVLGVSFHPYCRVAKLCHRPPYCLFSGATHSGTTV